MKNNNEANIESLQIDDDVFLESTAGFDNYLNHSCQPNAYIDWETRTLITLRDILAGEEITYNYFTSEYDMIFTGSDFNCRGKCLVCQKHINGFKYLSREEKMKISNFISPFLRKKL